MRQNIWNCSHVSSRKILVAGWKSLFPIMNLNAFAPARFHLHMLAHHVEPKGLCLIQWQCQLLSTSTWLKFFLPLSSIVIFNLIEVFFHFQLNCHLQLDCSFLQLSIIVMFNLIVGPVGGPRPWLPLLVGNRSRPAKNPLHRKCQHLQPPSFHIPYHICRYYLVVHICPVTKGPFL